MYQGKCDKTHDSEEFKQMVKEYQERKRKAKENNTDLKGNPLGKGADPAQQHPGKGAAGGGGGNKKGKDGKKGGPKGQPDAANTMDEGGGKGPKAKAKAKGLAAGTKESNW